MRTHAPPCPYEHAAARQDSKGVWSRQRGRLRSSVIAEVAAVKNLPGRLRDQREDGAAWRVLLLVAVALARVLWAENQSNGCSRLGRGLGRSRARHPT